MTTKIEKLLAIATGPENVDWKAEFASAAVELQSVKAALDAAIAFGNVDPFTRMELLATEAFGPGTIQLDTNRWSESRRLKVWFTAISQFGYGATFAECLEDAKKDYVKEKAKQAELAASKLEPQAEAMIATLDATEKAVGL